MKNLSTINKELKVYINESSFISNSCRNKIIKYFCEEFSVKLDISNYKNVDLSIKDDYKILYREDLYESVDNISSLEEVNERYERFVEKADKLLSRREIDFQNKSNVSNVTNLVIVICMFIIAVTVILFCIHSLFTGNVFNCIWFIVFILPMIVPRFKESLSRRLTQAKNYLKHLFKKVR